MTQTREERVQAVEAPQRPFVSAIVLAAGMSKRMGSLKQLMKMGDHTLLEHTLRSVAASNADEMILVLGYESETILRAIRLDDGDKHAKVVINDSYAEGMSSSIKAGLQSLARESDAALVILADQPLLTPAVLNQLMNEYRHSKAPIILPTYKGFRGNPVLVDRTLFAEMMEISGDVGCRSLFGLHPEQIHTVRLDDIGILIDIDTVDDLRRFSSITRSGPDERFQNLQLDDRAFEREVGSEMQSRKEERGRLVIMGGDAVASSLARMGKVLNWHVTILDPILSEHDTEADDVIGELDLNKVDVSPETNIVLASRGRYDEDALAQALETQAQYIGIVGSKKRVGEMIQRLLLGGVAEERVNRIKSPAGLKIHASTPEEIALSILAEIVDFRRTLGHQTRKT